MIRSILVPVDFSTCSLLVTRQAADLAAQLGAKLALLHVAELPAGVRPETVVRYDGAAGGVGEHLTDDTHRRLAPFVAAAAETGVDAQPIARLGPVVPTILAEADARRADLLVLGTHGRTGLARVLLGGVAEAVARAAHAPVMLVRREPRPECGRASCGTCTLDGRSPAETRIAVESDG